MNGDEFRHYHTQLFLGPVTAKRIVALHSVREHKMNTALET
jgi:hypothetical protein